MTQETPRSYDDIARFTETYSDMLQEDTRLRCLSSGTPLVQMAARSAIQLIKKYNQFPEALRKRMDFGEDSVGELQGMCSKELKLDE